MPKPFGSRTTPQTGFCRKPSRTLRMFGVCRLMQAFESRGCMAKLPAPPNCASLKHSNLQTRVFRRCYALRTVLAPGCKQFGTHFEECCSLIQFGANGDTTNQLAPQAELMPRAFEKCTALRHLDLGRPDSDSSGTSRCLPECCFLEGWDRVAVPAS